LLCQSLLQLPQLRAFPRDLLLLLIEFSVNWETTIVAGHHNLAVTRMDGSGDEATFDDLHAMTYDPVNHCVYVVESARYFPMSTRIRVIDLPKIWPQRAAAALPLWES
jgi:hypothetical protein